MQNFRLEILSATRTFYMGQCRSLILPLDDGLMGIMAHHSPMKVFLQGGTLTYTLPDETVVRCAVTRGMVDVQDERVQILCESVLLPEEIDEYREQQELEKAQKALRVEQGVKEAKLLQLQLQKAAINLRVKRTTPQ